MTPRETQSSVTRRGNGYRQTKMAESHYSMPWEERLNTLEKIWWGHELQVWDVGEQSDVMPEGCSGTWTGRERQVGPFPEPVLAPPHHSELSDYTAQVRMGCPTGQTQH